MAILVTVLTGTPVDPGDDAGAAAATALREPGSFRDRNGSVFYRGDRVFRSLSPILPENVVRVPIAVRSAADL